MLKTFKTGYRTLWRRKWRKIVNYSIIFMIIWYIVFYTMLVAEWLFAVLQISLISPYISNISEFFRSPICLILSGLLRSKFILVDISDNIFYLTFPISFFSDPWWYILQTIFITLIYLICYSVPVYWDLYPSQGILTWSDCLQFHASLYVAKRGHTLGPNTMLQLSF